MIKDGKSRPVACTKIEMWYSPLYNKQTTKFDSVGLPQITFLNSTVIDEEDGELNYSGETVGLLESAISDGVITVEQVSMVSDLFRTLREYSENNKVV